MQRSRLARLTAGVAILGLVLSACGPTGTGGSAAPSTAGGASAAPSTAAGGSAGTVKLEINPWVGAEANVAVVKRLLETKLGYTVTAAPLAEEVAWPGFDTGEIDAILENWGHPDLEKTYITDKGVAVDAGLNGVNGIIGWYIPEWMATQYPDIVDSTNLNKYADLFKTSESGDQGQFLGSDPTFVTNDEALIKNLGLNFKVVYSGSEAATITAFQQATEQKTPLIGYFYDPQWLLNEIKLVQIHLPPYTPGCDADLKKVACDYPPYVLNKIVRTEWLNSAGDAATFVKKFSWKNEDQNSVADSITNKNMKELDAAKEWIDANPQTWQAWIP